MHSSFLFHYSFLILFSFLVNIYFGDFFGLFLSSLLLFVFSMETMDSMVSRTTLHGFTVTLGETFFKTRDELCAGDTTGVCTLGSGDNSGVYTLCAGETTGDTTGVCTLGAGDSSGVCTLGSGDSSGVCTLHAGETTGDTSVIIFCG